MRTPRRSPYVVPLLALALVLAAPAAMAQLQPCDTQDDIAGGMALPPTCKYLSPNDVHSVEDPAKQAQILARPIHQFFVCKRAQSGASNDCRRPGGSLGGDVEQFSSEVVLELKGTGSLSGYQRTITVPNVAVEVHTSAQNIGSPQQDLTTDMVRLQGGLPPGDPDFARFEIVGGTYNGFPSRGRTVGTFNGKGWAVESYFDVGYTIEFVGAADSPLEGYEGASSHVTRMVASGQ
jgi:hypothetical protein